MDRNLPLKGKKRSLRSKGFPLRVDPVLGKLCQPGNKYEKMAVFAFGRKIKNWKILFLRSVNFQYMANLCIEIKQCRPRSDCS